MIQRLRINFSSKRLMTNIFIGMLIAVVVHIWHSSAVISRIENTAMDFMIQWTQGIISSRDQTVPFVFVDIDETTYRQWGEPTTIPKTKLTNILKFVNSGSPTMVVVDIDTSSREASDTGKELQESGLINLLCEVRKHSSR